MARIFAGSLTGFSKDPVHGRFHRESFGSYSRHKQVWLINRTRDEVGFILNQPRIQAKRMTQRILNSRQSVILALQSADRSLNKLMQTENVVYRRFSNAKTYR